MERNQIYKCEKCGNIVEVLHGGGAKLKCCGETMDLLSENTRDAALEKHVPVVESIEGGVRVTVGAVEHPMNEDHYIEWIEVIAGNKIYRKHLDPGDKPVAEFKLDDKHVIAREYCNLHGHWKK
ncbi:MAG: desulfoferrodoxin [Proteobacteria bacterium]|nr:desulfoferrodoxin [Pseudomonadota bacterium]